jgi:hypothetical protein
MGVGGGMRPPARELRDVETKSIAGGHERAAVCQRGMSEREGAS